MLKLDASTIGALLLAGPRRAGWIVLLTLCLPVASIVAQDTADTAMKAPSAAPGTPAGSYSLSDFENVNLFNGNLNVHLPLLQVGGRGGAQTTVMMAFDSRTWEVQHKESNGPVYNTPKTELLGAYPKYGPGILRANYGGTGGYGLLRLNFTTSDGTQFELRDARSNGKPQLYIQHVQGYDRGSVFVTSDGTSATFISTDSNGNPTSLYDSYDEDRPFCGYLILRDGTRYWFENTGDQPWLAHARWMRDRNGNRLTFDYYPDSAASGHHLSGRLHTITDSLNRVVTFTYTETQDTITYDGFGATARQIKVERSLLSADGALRSDYHGGVLTYGELFPEIVDLFNPYECAPDDEFDPWVIRAVILPDGRSYQFRYNKYGEIARIEVPTGGATEYNYTPGTGIINEDPHYFIHRQVVERRLKPNGITVEGKMKYSYAIDQPAKLTTTTVTHYDAVANAQAVEKHYYYGNPSPVGTSPTAIGYPVWKESREYMTESLDKNGATVLRRVEHTWENGTRDVWWTPGGSTDPANDPRITKTVTTLMDASPSKKMQQTFVYDDYNNQTEVHEYDYGNGAVGAKLRYTRTQYLRQISSGGPDYAADTDIHLRNLHVARQVFQIINGSEVEQSRTTYEYDKYGGDGNHAALTPRNTITGHDASFGSARQTRGNVTAISRWVKDEGREITTYQQYDVAGNLVRALDARGAQASPKYWTEISYTDNFGTPNGNADGGGNQNTYAYATSVTNAAGHNVRTQYDYSTGKSVDVKDANGVVTSLRYSKPLDQSVQPDLLDRLRQVVRYLQPPTKYSQTTFVYADGTPTSSVWTTSDLNVYGDNLLKTEVVYDGLGRSIETRSYETTTAFVNVKQKYDAMGRVSQQSSPARTGTGAWTYTRYDDLGRVVEVEAPLSAPVVTTYLNNTVTVRDQTGRDRKSTTDALGRLVEVVEDPGGLNYSTTYTYDALGNLLKVEQGGQERHFSYDSLSRLKTATNPESGLISYKYDDNSNLIEKQDARTIPQSTQLKVTTTYTYDKLNRVTSKSYNDGTPTVAYYYDDDQLPQAPTGFNRGAWFRGRLIAVTYGAAGDGSYYGYDALGRVTLSAQKMGTQVYSLPQYKYDLAGHLTSEKYPTGRVVTTTYDAAGRLSSVSAQRLPEPLKSYATQFYYTAHGAVAKVRLGNGLWEHTLFNTRLQPTEIGLGISATNASQLKLKYTYGEMVNGALATDKNNGNMQSQTITLQGLSLTQSYQYDELNRLKAAEEKKSGAQTWKQTYEYDRYGNRRMMEGTGQTTANVMPAANPTISQVNNRITASGYSYDAAGNMTGAPGDDYSFDAENRLVSFDAGTEHASVYTYDGEGHRVRKVVGIGSTAITTTFVYDAMSKLVSEYETKTAASESGVRYLTHDHLGSTRAVTSVDANNKAIVKSRSDYLPFGEQIAVGIGGRTQAQGYLYGSTVVDHTRQKFTGKERDDETGLDFFEARYYSNSHGRFTSIDPIYFQRGMLADPQRFNLYVYVRNNPLKFVDPSGMELHISLEGNASLVQFWLTTLAGDLGNRLTFERVNKKGVTPHINVHFNVSEFDVRGNEGARLIKDLVDDSHVFMAQAGGVVQGTHVSADGKSRVPFKKDVNKEGGGNMTRNRPGSHDEPSDSGVDSLIYIPENTHYFSTITGVGVPPIRDFIHEAAESYLLVKGYSYATSHGYYYGAPDRKGIYDVYPTHPDNAISREAMINDQLHLGGAPSGYYRQQGFYDVESK
jgi:RHS repeat-associated protein